ncbi:MAG: type VI secretion protein [Gallionellaceae bacterium]|nr:MAG: type VI secretion protein [Gallionellaceae bacterium]
MEVETRAAPGALTAVKQLAASPFGTALFEIIGQLVVARRHARSVSGENETVVQREKPEEVLKRIGDAPSEYELFSALRLVECAFQDKPRLGGAKRPRDEPIRVSQEVSLSFAASDIASVEPANEYHPPRLQQRVLGLFGPNGALPLHLTDYAYERKRYEGDATFARFVDVFHHRMLLLFYRAWANHQPVVSLDRPAENRFGGYVAALCGLGTPALRNRDSVDDLFKMGHAGILARHVKCAEGLQVLLADYFEVQVHIEEWVGYWLPVPESERTRLGSRLGFSMLGLDAVIGERIWDCQTRFRIVLGPLSLKNYQRFLPDGKSYTKLVDLVRLYVGEELAWEAQLILRREEVPLPLLGEQIRLGWTVWLGGRLEEQDADDLVI